MTDIKRRNRPTASDMRHAAFAAWRKDMDLSYAAAAALLGKSVRAVRYYENGNPDRTGSIPKTVADRCRQLLAAIQNGKRFPGQGSYAQSGRPASRHPTSRHPASRHPASRHD